MSANFNQQLNGELWRTGRLSDVKIIVEDAKFNVHKTILAASCPYFETLLYGSTKESKMNEITLKNTSKLIFAYMLEFIYVGKLDVCSMSERDLICLLRLAHEYQFDELFDCVISCIEIQKLKLNNVAQLLQMFSTYQMNDLKERCLLIFDERSEEVVKLKDLFDSFSSKLIAEIVSRDTFFANEVDIFKCLLSWSRSHSGDQTVFEFVRWNLISISDYVQIVKPTLVHNSDKYLTAVYENKSSRRIRRHCCKCKWNDERSFVEEGKENEINSRNEHDESYYETQCESVIYTYEGGENTVNGLVAINEEVEKDED